MREVKFVRAFFNDSGDRLVKVIARAEPDCSKRHAAKVLPQSRLHEHIQHGVHCAIAAGRHDFRFSTPHRIDQYPGTVCLPIQDLELDSVPTRDSRRDALPSICSSSATSGRIKKYQHDVHLMPFRCVQSLH
jgi:hypothetical protein